LDFELLAESGERVAAGAVPPDVDGLAGLAGRVAGFGERVLAAVESMNGARFVHDQLELHGWRVEIADALKVKGLAPLACKTDKIDSHVLAELCRRDLVPAIWLPTPEVRGERERARFRLQLVRQRVRLKSRIHATLLAFGHPCPVSDLFGVRGRELLRELELPEPWRSNLEASLATRSVIAGRSPGLERAGRVQAPPEAGARMGSGLASPDERAARADRWIQAESACQARTRSRAAPTPTSSTGTSSSRSTNST
jgi:transposase